jgi:hypothetical protein
VGQLKWKCDYCAQVFYAKDALEVHLKICPRAIMHYPLELLRKEYTDVGFTREQAELLIRKLGEHQ